MCHAVHQEEEEEEQLEDEYHRFDGESSGTREIVPGQTGNTDESLMKNEKAFCIGERNFEDRSGRVDPVPFQIRMPTSLDDSFLFLPFYDGFDVIKYTFCIT